MASPMRCTRRAFVRPGVPGGLPATITTRSPAWHRVISSRAASTWRTMSSVCATDGTRKVSAPQVSASWLRVADSVVNASSGIGDRYLASRRAVSPVMVKATSALAPTAAPTGMMVADLPMLRGRHRQPRYAMKAQFDATTRFDATDRLGQIAAPVLIVHGTSDHVAPVALARQMHALIPGSRLVLIDGGHLAPLLTQHERLVSEVSAFLTQSA